MTRSATGDMQRFQDSTVSRAGETVKDEHGRTDVQAHRVDLVCGGHTGADLLSDRDRRQAERGEHSVDSASGVPSTNAEGIQAR